jgi:multicomponent Na+:H+ antiporter subunit D
MVIPIAIYYLFAPFTVVLIGLLADSVKKPRIRDVYAVLVSGLGIVTVLELYYNLKASANQILVVSIGGKPPLGACLEIDMMGVYMAFSAALLGFFATVYSYNYMEHDTRLTEYYTLLSSLVVGMMGVAFAGDLLTLFIFWEMMGITSYSLVSFRKGSPGPIEAGFKYMVMGSIGSTVLFMGVAFLYGITGTVNLAQMSTAIHGHPINIWYYIVLVMMIIGLGVKSAIVPLHTWLPDAHPEAPSPISAMLSGMLIETALYALTRIMFVIFEPKVFSVTIAGLSVITMGLANLTALFQRDIKRMLAYSSIAQIGYMLIGVSAGSVLGAQGLMLHIFNHSLMKGLAFLSAGNIVHITHNRNIDELRGVGRAMPLTSLTLFISFLGLTGVPGTGGYISKVLLFYSAMGAGYWWLTILGVLNSALSVGYYLPAMYKLVGKTEKKINGVKEPPFLMLLVCVVMAVLILWTGVFPATSIGYAEIASKALIEGLKNYVGVIM